MTYNETPLAQEAKALIKHHLHLPDGVAQGHVDGLDEVQLANLVASRGYPPHDRPQVIRNVLNVAVPAPASPPAAATPDPPTVDRGPQEPPAPAEAATDEPTPEPSPLRRRRTRPD